MVTRQHGYVGQTSRPLIMGLSAQNGSKGETNRKPVDLFLKTTCLSDCEIHKDRKILEIEIYWTIGLSTILPHCMNDEFFVTKF